MKIRIFFNINSEKDIFMPIKYIIICIMLMKLISMAFNIKYYSFRNPVNIDDFIFEHLLLKLGLFKFRTEQRYRSFLFSFRSFEMKIFKMIFILTTNKCPWAG